MNRLIDNARPILGWLGAATSVDSPYINLGKADKVLVLLAVGISSGTATGAVALEQATDASGTGAKAVTFDKMFYVADVATDTPVETVVTSSTFDAGGVETTRRLYAIEIAGEQLDADNGYKFLRATVADITNGTIALTYIPYNLRIGGVSSTPSLLA